MTETVEVTAEAAACSNPDRQPRGVVTTQQVAELPLNARNPFMPGAMMSGVTFNGAAIWQRPFDNGAIAEWSINGSRNSNNEFLLDGAPTTARWAATISPTCRSWTPCRSSGHAEPVQRASTATPAAAF